MLDAVAKISSVVGNIVDKVVPDKSQAARLKNKITTELIVSQREELQHAMNVIVAEASGESWLQRNWRPLVMLFFTCLVGAHWLGMTSETLSEDQVLALLEIVKIGLGGYIIGRSAEKAVKAYKS